LSIYSVVKKAGKIAGLIDNFQILA